MGSVIIGWAFNDALWRDVMSKEFNLAMLAWGFWPNEIQPERGVFDFSVADRQIAFARQSGMNLRVDSLIFGNKDFRATKLPSWLKDGVFSKEEARDVLVAHIKSVVTRYQGIIKEWVVVNEPQWEPHRPDDIFHSLIGTEYIEIAYQAAREADPSAILNYSDTGNHTSRGWTTELTRQVADRLKSKGLIDVVGLQMHLDGSKPIPDKADVIATIRSYGLPVAITSVDVDLQDVGGSTAERYALQAEFHRSMFQAAMESGVCKDFSFWGVGDQYSWLERALSRTPMLRCLTTQ